MSKAEEYERAVRGMDNKDLVALWEAHKANNFDESFWKKGKVLEYVVLRSIELEIQTSEESIKGSVTYPYDVFMSHYENPSKPIEQIDGAVIIDELYALVECKDYNEEKIDIVPLAKLRNQLARRHSNVFGMFFSATEFTEPAEILLGYMAPQLIILWSIEDIEFCLNNRCFIPCMRMKYRKAIETCEYNYPYWLQHADEFENLVSEPLF